jgi:hypothetical protein
MDQITRVKTADCSKKIRDIGRQAIGANVVILLMTLLTLEQVGIPAIGEIGHFVHDATFVVIPFTIWGLATGIGLVQAWRWARISMLIFGGLLALFLSIPAGALLLMPGRGIGWQESLSLRIVGFVLLFPPVLTAQWHLYFLRNDVRAYFHRIRQASKISS